MLVVVHTAIGSASQSAAYDAAMAFIETINPRLPPLPKLDEDGQKYILEGKSL